MTLEGLDVVRLPVGEAGIRAIFVVGCGPAVKALRALPVVHALGASSQKYAGLCEAVVHTGSMWFIIQHIEHGDQANHRRGVGVEGRMPASY